MQIGQSTHKTMRRLVRSLLELERYQAQHIRMTSLPVSVLGIPNTNTDTGSDVIRSNKNTQVLLASKKQRSHCGRGRP